MVQFAFRNTGDLTQTHAAMAWRISMRRELDKLTDEVIACHGKLTASQAREIEQHVRRARVVLEGPLAAVLRDVCVGDGQKEGNTGTR
jgi:alkylation response protein AidB-like acyl-CoA dehydrogenase